MLVLSNGEYVVVEFVQHEILESPVKVYNFEVEDFHTYFVGEVSVLVHNGCEAAYDQQNNSVTLTISKSEYGAAAYHIDDYISTHNNLFVINRNKIDVRNRRRDSLHDFPSLKGLDRDEFPMAIFKEGGAGADVWYMDPHSNRSLGSAIGHALRPYSDGTKVKFNIVE